MRRPSTPRLDDLKGLEDIVRVTTSQLREVAQELYAKNASLGVKMREFPGHARRYVDELTDNAKNTARHKKIADEFFATLDAIFAECASLTEKEVCHLILNDCIERTFAPMPRLTTIPGWMTRPDFLLYFYFKSRAFSAQEAVTRDIRGKLGGAGTNLGSETTG